MSRQDALTAALRDRLTPTVLEIHDESHLHRGKAGKGTHYRVLVVSEAFLGKRLVERHRMVNAALSSVFEGGLHALALTTLDPEEFAAGRRGQPSPECAGRG